MQIDCLHILPALFGRILTVPEVIAELLDPAAPPPVRIWAAGPPPWLEIRPVTRPLGDIGLDPGETAAIALAVELRADRLLIDDRDARQAARERYQIQVAGTLAVLRDAGSVGVINFPTAIAALRRTTFRVSPKVLDALLENPPRHAGENPA